MHNRASVMLRRYSPPATEPAPSVPVSIARRRSDSFPGFTLARTRYRIRLFLRRRFSRRDCQIHLFISADDCQSRIDADAVFGQLPLQIVDAGDRMAIDRDQ